MCQLYLNISNGVFKMEGKEIDSTKEREQKRTITHAEMTTVVIWIYQLIKSNMFTKPEIIEIIKRTLCNFSKARSGEAFHTDYCTHNKPVESFCRDCDSFIDGPCAISHKEIRFLIPHSVIDFQRQPVNTLHVLDFAPKSFCRNPEHIPKEPWQNKHELLFYCTTCKVLLCQKGRQQHERHVVVTLDAEFNIKILIKDIIKLIEANPHSELKQIIDVLTSIISNFCRQNLVLIIKTLASVYVFDESSTHVDGITTLYARNMYDTPNTLINIDRSTSDTETLHTHAVKPPSQQEQDVRLTRNGSAVHVPCEENGFTKSADMERSTLPADVQNSIEYFLDLHPTTSS